MAFFLAMVMHPDVQRRAQAEIDSVVGKDRLPTIEDKEDSPFGYGIVAEINRWHTGPIGYVPTISHITTTFRILSFEGFPRPPAEYNGTFIQKGSTIISVIWEF